MFDQGKRITNYESACPAAYFQSPADYRTSTESEAVIGRALCNVGHLVST